MNMFLVFIVMLPCPGCKKICLDIQFRFVGKIFGFCIFVLVAVDVECWEFNSYCVNCLYYLHLYIIVSFKILKGASRCRSVDDGGSGH